MHIVQMMNRRIKKAERKGLADWQDWRAGGLRLCMVKSGLLRAGDSGVEC
jgi:hypothetical protein